MAQEVSCDFPLKAYRSASQRGPSGKPLLTFNPLDALQSTGAIEVPCGNCMGCKLEQSRQWAVRMLHESKCWDRNSFITLTYDDQHLPTDYGLSLRDLQLFFKRFRKSLGSQRIRFFACGEYGDLNGRPHYHAIVFNYLPDDRKKHQLINNKIHYVSESLTIAWQKGFATLTDVTYDSCAYVSRYVTKKIRTSDDFGAERYYRVSPVDGQMHSVKPEFAVMSRRPGIGKAYTEKFKSDYYPSGFVVVNGVRQAPPRYYRMQLTEEEQHRLKLNTMARVGNDRARKEKTLARRRVRAAVRDARISKLKRDL